MLLLRRCSGISEWWKDWVMRFVELVMLSAILCAFLRLPVWVTSQCAKEKECCFQSPNPSLGTRVLVPFIFSCFICPFLLCFLYFLLSLEN